MIKFKKFASLFEASAEDIQQYYKDIPPDAFKMITSADPTAGVKDGVVVRVGKFARDILGLYRKDKFDLAKLKELYADLAKAKKLPKQVNQYKTFDELFKDVQSLGVEKSAPIIFDKDGWKIRNILTQDAAVHFGCEQETGWCTSHAGGTYYKSHYGPDKGKLYIIYKDDKIHSQLFISHDKEFIEWNAHHNKQVNREEFFKSVPKSIGDTIQKMIKYEGDAFEFKGRTFKYKKEGDMIVFNNLNLSDMGLTSLMDLPWNKPQQPQQNA